MRKTRFFQNQNVVAIISILLMLGVIRGSSFILWLSVSDDVWSQIHQIIRFYLIEFICSCLLTLFFYLLIAFIKKLNLRLSLHILLLFIIALIFAVMMGLCRYGVMGFVWPEKCHRLFSENTLWYALSQLGNLFALASVYYFIDNWFKLKKERELTLEAVSLAQEARLQMLRYQLNPHFLFNALNSIRSLIEDDKVKARQVVSELSDFLRYSLIHARDGMVPMGKEIDAINNFFDIQKIRFDEKLEIAIDVADNVRDIPIPCFLIHPLVENAVKYGMQTSSVPLRIRVKAELKDGDQLDIWVSNSGHLLDGDEQMASHYPVGTGTGIQNVKQRLQHTYGECHSFDLIENAAWVHAHIQVSLDKLQL